MLDFRDRRAWHEKMNPEEAVTVLRQAYAELAGEEALFRALLAERDLNRKSARFWIGVYAKVSG